MAIGQVHVCVDCWVSPRVEIFRPITFAIVVKVDPCYNLETGDYGTAMALPPLHCGYVPTSRLLARHFAPRAVPNKR